MTIRKVLITGATGFIGRHLTKRLVAEGYTVGALVRTASPTTSSFSTESVTLFFGDIRNYEEIKAAFLTFKPDAVMHLVTYYAVMHRAEDIGTMVDTNVKGTINLLEASKESGSVQLFINTSSCAVYGRKEQPLSEGDAIRPQNLYAVTKLHAEDACSYYATDFHLPTVTLRLFAPYGPGDSARRLIPYVIGSILKGIPPNLTTGKQEWDFVFVEDIVSAYLSVLRSYPFGEDHAIFNIGTGDPVSIRSLVEKIRTLMGSSVDLPWGTVPHRSNEVWYNSADISRAKNRLGWSPDIGIDDGLEKTVAWFRDYFSKDRDI
jgi:nucleoside-diphosphate-sugar epimerase